MVVRADLDRPIPRVGHANLDQISPRVQLDLAGGGERRARLEIAEVEISRLEIVGVEGGERRRGEERAAQREGEVAVLRQGGRIGAGRGAVGTPRAWKGGAGGA